MKNMLLLGSVAFVCIIVWGVTLFTFFDYEKNNRSKSEQTVKVELEQEFTVVSDDRKQLHYQTNGITREDAYLIAPNQQISVDELLDIVNN